MCAHSRFNISSYLIIVVINSFLTLMTFSWYTPRYDSTKRDVYQRPKRWRLNRLIIRISPVRSRAMHALIEIIHFRSDVPQVVYRIRRHEAEATIFLVVKNWISKKNFDVIQPNWIEPSKNNTITERGRDNSTNFSSLLATPKFLPNHRAIHIYAEAETLTHNWILVCIFDILPLWSIENRQHFCQYCESSQFYGQFNYFSIVTYCHNNEIEFEIHFSRHM